MSIIGLPDQAIKEAGERIQAAIESCGYEFPKDKCIISLAPGDKKKRGSHFDLGMIIALLFQTDQISPKKLADYAFIGELALDGRIMPCNGVLSMVTEARKCGVKAVVVPYENSQEAASVTGIQVCPVQSLPETMPREYFFPKRNRLIAALSVQLYVIDAGRTAAQNPRWRAVYGMGGRWLCCEENAP